MAPRALCSAAIFALFPAVSAAQSRAAPPAVVNPLGVEVRDIAVVIPSAVARRHYRALLGSGQFEDSDGDGTADRWTALVNVDARSTRTLTQADLRPPAAPRAFAMLEVKTGGRFAGKRYIGGNPRRVAAIAVPPMQEQDSGWASFEGPVWESDRIGFRYYLDDRNLTDVFGKRTPAMALASAAGNYHKIADWGADILKVGPSLGIGSPALWSADRVHPISGAQSVTVRIAESGPLVARIVTDFRAVPIAGERGDIKSNISIRGGSRASEQRLTATGFARPVFATGIVRHPAAPALVTGEEAGFFFAYSWGKQSDQGHWLGMAILVPLEAQPDITGDAASHIVRIRPTIGGDGKAHAVYRYLGGWELDAQPITSEPLFVAAIREEARRWRLEVANGAALAPLPSSGRTMRR